MIFRLLKWRCSQILLVWFGLIVFLVIFVYYGIPYIYEKCSIKALKNKAVQSKALFLTFDDGPSDNLTGAVMDLLDGHNVKASFFTLGRNIAGRENIVGRMAERGHEICSHGFDHLNYWKIFPWLSIKDIKKGWDAIDTALGVKRGKYPFRPPYGKLNIVSLIYLLLKKVPVIYWTEDSGDTWEPRPESDRIAKVMENSSGDVTLCHDFNRSGISVESWVLNSVRFAIEKAKEKNMNVFTVSELL